MRARSGRRCGVIDKDEASVDRLVRRLRRHTRPQSLIWKLEIAGGRARERPRTDLILLFSQLPGHVFRERVQPTPELPELITVKDELGVLLHRVGIGVVAHELLERCTNVAEENELIAAPGVGTALRRLVADRGKR